MPNPFIILVALGAGLLPGTPNAYLTGLATDLGHKPVVVTCAAKGTTGGQAFVGQPYILLGGRTCYDAVQGETVGVLSLLHEYAHTLGIRNEGQANCVALSVEGFVLQKYWYLKAKVALTRVREAYRFVMRQQPQAYHPVNCRIKGVTD